jgi:hypothetical protein
VTCKPVGKGTVGIKPTISPLKVMAFRKVAPTLPNNSLYKVMTQTA